MRPYYIFQWSCSIQEQNRSYDKLARAQLHKTVTRVPGLTWFYPHFVNYASIGYALIELLQKDALPQIKAQIAFDALKLAMTEPPVLKLPDFTKQVVI